MMNVGVSQARADRCGRPLLFSVTEAVALVLVTAALIATAAIPAVLRHPHVARAQTVSSVTVHP